MGLLGAAAPFLIKEAIDAAQTVRRSCATNSRLTTPLVSIGGVGDSGEPPDFDCHPAVRRATSHPGGSAAEPCRPGRRLSLDRMMETPPWRIRPQPRAVPR